MKTANQNRPVGRGRGLLRYIYGRDLHRYSALAETMFRDRAYQFKTRLGWDVSVDENGLERDQYDPLNPLYTIWERADGTHGASCRYLPTVGCTMLNEHFRGALPGLDPIRSPYIWEVTRYCLSPEGTPTMRYALELASGEIMRNYNIAQFVGVVDPVSLRKYRQQGSPIEHLGSMGRGRASIHIIAFEYHQEMFDRALAALGCTAELSLRWFAQSMAANAPHAPQTVAA